MNEASHSKSGAVARSARSLNAPQPEIILEPLEDGITDYRKKRWMCLNIILEYETNYLKALTFLTKDLEAGLRLRALLISSEQCDAIFAHLGDIRDMHQQFRHSLKQSVDCFKQKEMLGWWFGVIIEQPMLLRLYGKFAATHRWACQQLRTALEENTLFRAHVRCRLQASEMWVGLDGLLLKPIQRLPHLRHQILTLIKWTPENHPDFPMLENCLERTDAIVAHLDLRQGQVDTLTNVMRKTFPVGVPEMSLGHAWHQNQLLHCTEVLLLDVDRNGRNKEAQRRIFLMLDRVVCVKVCASTNVSGADECLKLEWMYPLETLYMQCTTENEPRGRLTAADIHPVPSVDVYTFMMSRIHDHVQMKRVRKLVRSLHNTYSDLGQAVVGTAVQELDAMIKEKNDQSLLAQQRYNAAFMLVRMSPAGAQTASDEKHYRLKFLSNTQKNQFLIKATLAQLSLNPNSPSTLWWLNGERLSRIYEPMFVSSVATNFDQTELQSVCYLTPNYAASTYSHMQPRDWMMNNNVLWLCSSNRRVTYVSLYTHEVLTNYMTLRINLTLSMPSVKCMVHVPKGRVIRDDDQAEDTVWIGTEQEIRIFSAVLPPGTMHRALVAINLNSPVQTMVHQRNRVYVGLLNGVVLVYRCFNNIWNMSDLKTVHVSNVRISAMLPINGDVYVAAGCLIRIIQGTTDTLLKNKLMFLESDHDEVQQMVYSVNGLWILWPMSRNLSVYHLKPWQHQQDIDITIPMVAFALKLELEITAFMLYITTITVHDQTLWIGTSIGVTLLLPLPAARNIPVLKDFMFLANHECMKKVSFIIPLLKSTAAETSAEIGCYDAFTYSKEPSRDWNDESDDDLAVVNWTASPQEEDSDNDDIEIVSIYESATAVSRLNSEPQARGSRPVYSDIPSTSAEHSAEAAAQGEAAGGSATPAKLTVLVAVCGQGKRLNDNDLDAGDTPESDVSSERPPNSVSMPCMEIMLWQRGMMQLTHDA